MELSGEATLLRVFLGEADKVGHTALYEAIVSPAGIASKLERTMSSISRGSKAPETHSTEFRAE